MTELAVDDRLLVLVADGVEQRGDHRANVGRIIGEVTRERRLGGRDFLECRVDRIGRAVLADGIARGLEVGRQRVDISPRLLEVAPHDVEQLRCRVPGVHRGAVDVARGLELGRDTQVPAHLRHGRPDGHGISVEGGSRGGDAPGDAAQAARARLMAAADTARRTNNSVSLDLGWAGFKRELG